MVDGVLKSAGILGASVDLNAQAATTGMTALALAAQHGYTGVIRALVIAGADAKLAGCKGRTPLQGEPHLLLQ